MGFLTGALDAAVIDNCAHMRRDRYMATPLYGSPDKSWLIAWSSRESGLVKSADGI